MMPGRAFSIEDALIAIRWGEQILPRGYRVVITPRHEQAEEVIEVYIPDAIVPAFRARRTAKAVLIMDCLGMTSSFPTLAGALLAITPLSALERREMLKGASPAWLPALPGCPARHPGSLWSRASKSMVDLAAKLTSLHQG